jgi:cytochrome c oxidase assembly protein subunit 15
MQPQITQSSQSTQSARRLAWGFASLVAAVVGLMVLGALVRAHGAGLACPDWPLCFGEVIPRMDIKVAFEWSHRVVAGSVAIVFVILSAMGLRHPGIRADLRRPLTLAALFLAVQILLGALTVWQLLATWTVTAHLVTANLFAVTLLVVSLRLRDRARGGAPSATHRAGRILIPISAILLAAQIVLGGLVSSSYAGMACPEWPTCINGEWFPAIGGNVALHLLHRTTGYLVLVVLAMSAFACRGQRPLGALTAAAFALAVAQVVVGVFNVRLGLPVDITGLHSLLAAILVLTLSASVYRTFAGPSPARV